MADDEDTVLDVSVDDSYADYDFGKDTDIDTRDGEEEEEISEGTLTVASSSHSPSLSHASVHYIFSSQ